MAIEPPNQMAVDVFEKSIRPLLVTHCYECHGPETGEGEAGLRLDSLAGILTGGVSGPAVSPGKPLQSLLLHAVNHEPTVTAMPPEERLSAAEISTLTRWIKISGPWPVEGLSQDPKRLSAQFHITDRDRNFWAFVLPTLPELPEVRDRSLIRTPIDSFVLAKLEEAGITPASPAGKRQLIRRATYDLHGLPPTPVEVAEFVRDESPNAFERVIDRLLESPRYGEKWGRHWLDVARYSDSNGMDDNIAFADAWRFRDYVISAFNTDKPYDQFVREQVAGDLLTSWDSENRAEAIIATTFLMLGQKQPSADDPVKQQLDIVDEQLDTLTRGFLAMTIACARCHDHKFDPISQQDYYGLAGILRSTTSMLSHRVDAKFNVTALSGRADNHLVSLLEQQMDEHDDVLVNGNKSRMSAAQKQTHTDQLNDAYDEMGKIPTAMAVKDGQVSDMPVFHRGNHLTPANMTPRGVPQILMPREVPTTERSAHADPANHNAAGRPDDSGDSDDHSTTAVNLRNDGRLSITAGESGRRELAEWLTSESNPLTARVMVNRIWHWHMGAGIVESPDNFGRLGQRPKNQELLDWLTVRFIESGWSMKELHRLIMSSTIYRMQPLEAPSTGSSESNHALCLRITPRRLTAEEIRDSLLAISQQLDMTMGGRTLPVRNHKIMNADEISRCNQLHDQPRRTVYQPVIRSGLDEFLTTFDFPDPSVPAGSRHTTTVAPQALYMMNSPLVRTSSRLVAERLAGIPDSTVANRVQFAYELLLSRQATDNEIDLWSSFISQGQPSDTGSAAGSDDSTLQAWESLVRILLSSNDFTYVK
ncbi:MAG: PSD1 and planctomycete cytochrome C domain-containing protein [Planctomycetaceae bacterium]